MALITHVIKKVDEKPSCVPFHEYYLSCTRVHDRVSIDLERKKLKGKALVRKKEQTMKENRCFGRVKGRKGKC